MYQKFSLESQRSKSSGCVVCVTIKTWVNQKKWTKKKEQASPWISICVLFGGDTERKITRGILLTKKLILLDALERNCNKNNLKQYSSHAVPFIKTKRYNGIQILVDVYLHCWFTPHGISITNKLVWFIANNRLGCFFLFSRDKLLNRTTKVSRGCRVQ